MVGEPDASAAAAGRGELARLLAEVPPARLAAVARDLFEPSELPKQTQWQDSATVIDRIEAIPTQPDGVPPLLVFVARLARELSGRAGDALLLWLDARGAAAGVNRHALRRLYDRSSPVRDALEFPISPEAGSSIPGASPEPSTAPGVTTLTSRTSVLPPLTTTTSGQPPGTTRIWGGVPLRNPDFTGRADHLLRLQRALEARSKASVLPQALHGHGGVGKTQLAVEFAYRYADRYDLVWWIPAEQQSGVLQSLSELGQSLGVPRTENLQQAASLVLGALDRSDLRWLLIYDNAIDPDDIANLIPSRGGHVILTSRNQTWSDVWDAVEVDVFNRQESVSLVRRRGPAISPDEADQLADRLGDLPLALDQASSWQAATKMAAPEFLALLDRHVQELTDEDRPAAYPVTIAALLRLAFERLRVDAPAVAQLLEMFAFLGAEPISTGLLWNGRAGKIAEPLGHQLRNRITLGRITRDLRRYGLAKVDPDQRIQVHRLFQLVLRDGLSEDAARQSRANVQQLLASANPGEPDDDSTWAVHAEIGPHIEPAGLVEADLIEARRVVLDQIRYLYVMGDNEGARQLGEMAVRTWSKEEGVPGLGAGGELTLIATRHLANALRASGVNERARVLNRQTYDRLYASPEFGPNHEHTLSTAGGVAADLRVAGAFREALTLDYDILQRHTDLYGEDDPLTWRTRSNLAVTLRMLGDFDRAYEIDQEIADLWRQTVSENDVRLLFVEANMVRDLYGLGRYPEALTLQHRMLPPYREQLGSYHPSVLLATRTLAYLLRKTGSYADALRVAEEHYGMITDRFGHDHEHSLAAAMTYANSLRVMTRYADAHDVANEATERYRRVFGDDHPLSLAAAANYAIILRTMGVTAEATDLDVRTHQDMIRVFGEEHSSTLCVASGLATDHAAAGDVAAARRLSEDTLTVSRRTRGHRHPYTLACAANAALDLIASGEQARGQALRAETVSLFDDVLGPEHPETQATREGARAECDIEPPPS